MKCVCNDERDADRGQCGKDETSGMERMMREMPAECRSMMERMMSQCCRAETGEAADQD